MNRSRVIGKGVFGPLLAAALVAGATAAWAGEMVTVSRSVEIDKPAGEVWAVVGEFGKLDTWHPAVASLTTNGDGGSGLHRILALEGGGEIDETLTSYSLPGMSYSYVINSSPLPVANYASTITVKENGGNASTIVWESTFEPNGASSEEASKVIGGIYEAGFASVVEKLKN